jgi:hypothetical protein
VSIESYPPHLERRSDDDGARRAGTEELNWYGIRRDKDLEGQELWRR